MATPSHKYQRSLQRELNVITQPIIKVNCRNIGCRFTGAVFERNCEIVFPFAVSWRARIIRDHRRTALAKRNSRRACEA